MEIVGINSRIKSLSSLAKLPDISIHFGYSFQVCTVRFNYEISVLTIN